MHRTKHSKYVMHTAELERANVQYEPMVWSAFGRPHPNTVLILKQLAKKGARRRGLLDPSQLERRAKAKIGVEIWRRAARMVMACLPRADEEEAEDAGEIPLGKSEPPDVVLVG